MYYETALFIADKDVYVYRSREGELMEYDAANNVTRLIMDNTTFVCCIMFTSCNQNLTNTLVGNKDFN